MRFRCATQGHPPSPRAPRVTTRGCAPRLAPRDAQPMLRVCDRSHPFWAAPLRVPAWALWFPAPRQPDATCRARHGNRLQDWHERFGRLVLVVDDLRVIQRPWPRACDGRVGTGADRTTVVE